MDQDGESGDGKKRGEGRDGKRGKLENMKFRQASKRNSFGLMSCLLFSPLKLIYVKMLNVEF